MRKVISDLQEATVVGINNITAGKIYVSNVNGTLYKLQGMQHNWMFCGLDNSLTGSSGTYSTIHTAIQIQLGFADVYELDNINELITWLRDNR